MRTIITLCRIAVIALVVTGCWDLPYGVSTVTISNKSDYNLRMIDTSDYSQYLDVEDIKREERIIKKNQTVSFELGQEGIAPSAPEIIGAEFYNLDTGRLIKVFKKSDNIEMPKYVLTKEEGTPTYSGHKKWYRLEITDAMLRR